MKTKNTLLPAVVVGLALMLPACKKYEDGPALSLRSKKARLANTWKIENAYDNGNDVTGDYDAYQLELTRDETATITLTYEFGGSTIQFQTTGTWALINKKDDLRLDFADDDADVTYEILRLKEKELWLREKGDDAEIHLIPG